MDSFEYLIALVSVVAGLGITRALSGLARLLNARHQITFSWIPICWTVSVLLWLIAFWWFTFLLSSYEEWSPALHVFVLVYAGAIFFLLALLHPEAVSEGHDMLAHFLDNRKIFFGTLLAVALIDVADTWIKYRLGLSTPPAANYMAFMGTWMLASVVAMFARRPRLHSAIAVIFLVAVLLWQALSIDGILEVVRRST